MTENEEYEVTAPAGRPKRTIRYGLMKGKLHVADDFDAPLPDDVLAEFEDGPIEPPEYTT